MTTTSTDITTSGTTLDASATIEAGSTVNRMAPVLLAIDGNSLAHRAYHAYGARGNELTDSQGRPREAVYGFMSLVVGTAHKAYERFGRLDGIVIGFDDPDGSHRRAGFPAYKAGRSAKDESLIQQLKDIVVLLNDLGIPTIVPPLWEADDVLGSASQVAADAGYHCVVATSDRDACALVSDSTSMFRLTGGIEKAQWLDPAGVLAQFGVIPERYSLYAAVRGDSSDNLDGVPGLGEKKASALWATYANIDEALADTDALEVLIGKRGAASLAEHAGIVARNLDIMAIRRDIEIDIEACSFQLSLDEMLEVLRKWELPGLVPRARAMVNLFDGATAPKWTGNPVVAPAPATNDTPEQPSLFG